MMKQRFFAGFAHFFLGVALCAGGLLGTPARGATDETFPLLQIGTVKYTNVTVTTKAKTYIFILHDGGMANIKLTDLSTELQETLGYRAPRPATNQMAAWAKQQMAKVETPQVKELSAQVAQRLGSGPQQTVNELLKLVGPQILMLVGGLLLLCYLVFSYCSMLICRKAGTEPGVLVWVPVLQSIPLLRAAGMSGWWLVGCLIPGLNAVVSLVMHVLWSFKIARARGKSSLVGWLLLLPVVNVLAFLYLAFSDAGEEEEEKPSAKARPQLMTLETA